VAARNSKFESQEFGNAASRFKVNVKRDVAKDRFGFTNRNLIFLPKNQLEREQIEN